LLAVLQAFKGEYALAGLIMLIASALSYVAPFLVHMILDFLEAPGQQEEWKGAKYLAWLVGS